jgi:hypothetical protein
MPVQDQNPERRNLALTSISIILFYLAGGHLENNTVRLQVINVNFDNPEVLTSAVWLALLWFAYRYWVTHRGSIWRGINSEISHFSNDRILKAYIAGQTGERVVADEENGQHISGVNIERHNLVAIVQVANDVRRDSTSGQIKSAKSGLDQANAKRLPVTGWKGRAVAIWLIWRTFISHPTFSAYVFPWMLFALALVMGFGERALAF